MHTPPPKKKQQSKKTPKCIFQAGLLERLPNLAKQFVCYFQNLQWKVFSGGGKLQRFD